LRNLLAVIALTIAIAAGFHCTAQAGGADNPWGAEVSPSAPESAGDKPKSSRKRDKSSPRAAAGPLSLTGDRSATMARLEVQGSPQFEVFTVAGPYRVIIELTGASVASPPKPDETGFGLVERYHAGSFEAGKSRVVMETVGPVKATAFPAAPGKGGSTVIEIALTPMAVNEFGQGSKSRAAAQAAAEAAAKNAASAAPDSGAGVTMGGVPPDFGAGLPGMAPPAPPARPVIVIDPGHGGIDPGAVGVENLYEKAIVMAVAQKLEKVLKDKDRYQVMMTRTSDVFVALDQRVAFSRKSAANLFISLHADSLEQTAQAQTISGATVYTLSERASDEQARIMAEKENASDLLGGISTDTSGDDDVKNILFDLMKRETATFSAEFANVLRGNLGKSIQMSRDPMRSAAFKVLKQTHAPSVLIELGYMSNSNDAKRLNSPDWQIKVATAIGAAIDAYFSGRTARAK